MVVQCEYRVIYGDTDVMGVIYHSNYYRFFERGRNEYMRARGLTYREVEAQGLMLPVTESRCRYLQPGYYDDLLTIETRVTRAKGARVKFEYCVKNDAGVELVTGETEHGLVDGQTGRPARLPEELIEKLAPE